jgi:hypothetical protein
LYIVEPRLTKFLIAWQGEALKTKEENIPTSFPNALKLHAHDHPKRLPFAAPAPAPAPKQKRPTPPKHVPLEAHVCTRPLTNLTRKHAKIFAKEMLISELPTRLVLTNPKNKLPKTYPYLRKTASPTARKRPTVRFRQQITSSQTKKD